MEPAAIRAGQRLIHGRGTGALQRPRNMEGHISYILAHRHTKLGTHIELINTNNFRIAYHRLRPTGSWLFGVYYSYLSSKLWGLLGSLTYSKTLENLRTLWNLWPLGACRGWDPGVAQGLYSAPWNMEGHISYILARRRMKLGTHINLINPNNFCIAYHRLCPTGSWLFRV